MFLILLTIFISCYAAYSLSGHIAQPTQNKNSKKIFYMLMLAGLFIRLVSSVICYGHQTDVTDFIAWSDMLYHDGIPAFYLSDSFTDYPPGYMYILWILGFLKNTLSLSGGAELILIKLPAIIADLLLAKMLFSLCEKEQKGNSLLISSLIIFNPAVILNSSLWGQVDSIIAALMTAVIILLMRKKSTAAYFTFAIAIFVKPQALMYTPILLYYFWENTCRPFVLKDFIRHILTGASAILSTVILSVPFGVTEVFEQYVKTLSSYPYLTVNAFNLWGALGQNWEDVTPLASAIGTAFIVIITLASFYIMHKKKDSSKYFFTASFLCFSVFMLSVRMHERYAYPAMIFMIFAFASFIDFRKYILGVLLSLSQLFNTAYILFIYETDPGAYFKSPVIIAASIINLAILLYFAYASDKSSQPLICKKENNPCHTEFQIENSSEKLRLTKHDFIIMGVITVIYSVIGFLNLGDMHAPENGYMLDSNDSVTIEFANESNINSITFFNGEYPIDDGNAFIISFYDENGNNIKTLEEKDTEVFFRKSIDCEIVAKSLTITAGDKISIKELCFNDTTANETGIINIADYPELFDEQEYITGQQTYMNSTYFDEIYHARTAYEFIHKLPVYEWTHPPLGKILISLGIRIFGMNPFGWRCVGVLFGIMMVPLIYLLSKLLCKKTWLSSVVTIIFTFDFMHYAQTRIATIDVYVTFFVMLMYLFMFAYAKKSFYDTPLKKTFIPLGLCGISMGLAIASKWTGIYASAGLALIFFITLYKRYLEFRYAKTLPDGITNGISHSKIIELFPKNATKTILFCILFFVVIPIGIYMISYIPYLAANSQGISGIWENQLDIFTYHAETVVESTHSYSSPWYSWPIIARPIWYYSNSFSNGTEAGISAFGNPLVWWAGIISTLYCLMLMIKKHDKTATMLIIGYGANYLPWAVITRTTFIYHYFPSVPFVVLMTGYAILNIYKQTANKYVKSAAIIYAGLCILLFFAYYPVLTGTPVNPDYVSTFLRWFDSWVLV